MGRTETVKPALGTLGSESNHLGSYVDNADLRTALSIRVLRSDQIGAETILAASSRHQMPDCTNAKFGLSARFAVAAVCLRGRCSSDAIHGQTGNVNLTIRIVWITFAVSAEQGGTDSGNVEEALNHAGFPQGIHQEITLGIDVWRDVMGDLTSVMAQADPAIEGY